MKLTVRSIEQKNAGRGNAALHPRTMQKLGVQKKDNLLLTGPKGSCGVRVWSAKVEEGCIQIDGRTRSRLGVSVDDTISVEPEDVPDADRIRVALPEDFPVDEETTEYIREKLSGQPVKAGQNIPLQPALGSRPNEGQSVYVIGTTPDELVIVGDETAVHLDKEPTEEFVSSAEPVAETPDVTYEDLGGLSSEIGLVREMIELPMRHPELFQQVGVDPPKGILMKGPPGTGKTLLAKAVANEVDAEFFNVSGPELLSSDYGGSEEELRELFEKAREKSPSIIFLDEIDAIAGKRDGDSHEATQRVVAQLLSLMDGVEGRGDVVVMAATNRADSIDPALRRGGRFDREVEIGVPDKDGRLEILEIHSRGVPLNADVDIEEVSSVTHGFVGADLASLMQEAAMSAIRRVSPEINLDRQQIPPAVLRKIQLCQEDFKEALKQVEPSAMREVFADVPDVSWDDVGGLEDLKEQLNETIQWPLDHPEAFEAMGVEPATGVMLYGPPGTGKTMLAKAVASESSVNFISVRGPELMNKYVGESAKGVREVFRKARENAPTVIFFDEIDAIAGHRGEGSNEVSEQVVSQLLTEMDGLEDLEDVVVIAATNRPDMIDSALLRPGRLDRHIHVGVPDYAAREAIFNVHLGNKPLAQGVDAKTLADVSEGYVGADIEAICREAAMESMRHAIRDRGVSPDDLDGNATVTIEQFERAIESVTPTVDDEMKEKYEKAEERFESMG